MKASRIRWGNVVKTTECVRSFFGKMQISKHGQRIADFLGLKKNISALLAMVILVGLGEKMAERFLPLYLMALGGGAFSVGLLNGLDNLLSALYSLPGGYASDKLGYKRALLLFNLIAMAGYGVGGTPETGAATRLISWPVRNVR